MGVVKGDGTEQPKVLNCSTAEYWERAGFEPRRKGLEARLHRAPVALEQWQSETPSSKTASIAALQGCIQYSTQRLLEIPRFDFERAQRAKRWEVQSLASGVRTSRHSQS